jgi:hypothetical protein
MLRRAVSERTGEAILRHGAKRPDAETVSSHGRDPRDSLAGAGSRFFFSSSMKRHGLRLLFPALCTSLGLALHAQTPADDSEMPELALLMGDLHRFAEHDARTAGHSHFDSQSGADAAHRTCGLNARAT